MAFVTVVTVAAATGTVACGSLSVEDCAESEVFVVLVSDVDGEDDEEECVPVPAECADDLTCDCLGSTQDTSDLNWQFCVGEGSCTETADGIEVVCPGG
jgi:hypothetical protein